MDPFTEKEMIDLMKKIAGSLDGIEEQLINLNVAIREANYIEEEDENLNEESGKLRNKIGDEFSEEDEKKDLVVEIDDDDEDLGDSDEQVVGFSVSEEDAVTSEEFKGE